jgi:hypothetical protein
MTYRICECIKLESQENDVRKTQDKLLFLLGGFVALCDILCF